MTSHIHIDMDLLFLKDEFSMIHYSKVFKQNSISKDVMFSLLNGLLILGSHLNLAYKAFLLLNIFKILYSMPCPIRSNQ